MARRSRFAIKSVDGIEVAIRMRVSLAQLLQERDICHPSRIIAATFENRELRVRVSGCPWWDELADRAIDHEIEFVFGGVGEGLVAPLDFDASNDDALEQFCVDDASELPWHQPNGSVIYCNAPLPRPLEIYRVVHDFLESHGAFRDASSYLNCVRLRHLSHFVRTTQSSCYQLGEFPPALRDAVLAELDAQGVSYTELPTRFHAEGKLLVTLQNSQFFCESAVAIFGE